MLVVVFLTFFGASLAVEKCERRQGDPFGVKWHYEARSGKCFTSIQVKGAANFTTGTSLCHSMGAMLATVQGPATNSFITSDRFLPNRLEARLLMIGLRFVHGDGQWDDNTYYDMESYTAFTNASLQQSNRNVKEEQLIDDLCTVIAFDPATRMGGRWARVGCSMPLPQPVVMCSRLAVQSEVCSPGTFGTRNNTSSLFTCHYCPENMFQPRSNQESCKKCPGPAMPGFFIDTRKSGATSQLQCYRHIPVVTDFEPKFGAIAGGTVVSVRGKNFFVGKQFMVLFNSRPGKLISSSNKLLKIETPPLDDQDPVVISQQYNSSKFVATFQLMFHDDVFYVEYFTYRNNPIVHRYSTSNFASGAAQNVTVFGENLDAADDVAMVMVVSNGTSSFEIKADCHVVNSTQMWCQMPDLNEKLPREKQKAKSFRRIRPRQAQPGLLSPGFRVRPKNSSSPFANGGDNLFSMNSGWVQPEEYCKKALSDFDDDEQGLSGGSPWTTRVEFAFDSNYRTQAESIADNEVLIFKDPTFEQWSQEKDVQLPGPQTLTINGVGFLCGLKQEEYHVSVGQLNCPISQVTMTQIECVIDFPSGNWRPIRYHVSVRFGTRRISQRVGYILVKPVTTTSTTSTVSTTTSTSAPSSPKASTTRTTQRPRFTTKKQTSSASPKTAKPPLVSTATTPYEVEWISTTEPYYYYEDELNASNANAPGFSSTTPTKSAAVKTTSETVMVVTTEKTTVKPPRNGGTTSTKKSPNGRITTSKKPPRNGGTTSTKKSPNGRITTSKKPPRNGGTTSTKKSPNGRITTSKKPPRNGGTTSSKRPPRTVGTTSSRKPPNVRITTSKKPPRTVGTTSTKKPLRTTPSRKPGFPFLSGAVTTAKYDVDPWEGEDDDISFLIGIIVAIVVVVFVIVAAIIIIVCIIKKRRREKEDEDNDIEPEISFEPQPVVIAELVSSKASSVQAVPMPSAMVAKRKHSGSSSVRNEGLSQHGSMLIKDGVVALNASGGDAEEKQRQAELDCIDALANLPDDVEGKVRSLLIESGRVKVESTFMRGHFGELAFGNWAPTIEHVDREPVYIKSLNRYMRKSSVVRKFLDDALLMEGCGENPNCLPPLAVAFRRGRPIVLYPNVDGINLKVYLNDAGVMVLIRQMIDMASQIASAMTYLSETRNIIHGDIAPRNCILLPDNNYLLKLTDSALVGDMHGLDYEYVEEAHDFLPVRWNAPETLLRLEYSVKTDVWTFGVTLWELFMRSHVKPFGDIHSVDIVNSLRDKANSWLARSSEEIESQPQILVQPKQMPDEINDVMISCLHPRSQHRPTFSFLNERLTMLLDENETRPSYNRPVKVPTDSNN